MRRATTVLHGNLLILRQQSKTRRDRRGRGGFSREGGANRNKLTREMTRSFHYRSVIRVEFRAFPGSRVELFAIIHDGYNSSSISISFAETIANVDLAISIDGR